MHYALRTTHMYYTILYYSILYYNIVGRNEGGNKRKTAGDNSGGKYISLQRVLLLPNTDEPFEHSYFYPAVKTYVFILLRELLNLCFFMLCRPLLFMHHMFTGRKPMLLCSASGRFGLLQGRLPLGATRAPPTPRRSEWPS